MAPPALAKQLVHLGTETAFAVAALAADWRARGNTVYPFHLGDIDMPPPEPLIEGVTAAIRDGKNNYCPGGGVPLFREQLAAYFNAIHNVSYTAENIAAQPGGKPVIGKFLQAVMNPNDEVLYPVPGFPIYESQIRYQGGVAVPYHYRDDGNGSFRLDTGEIRERISNKTCALIFNNYHNPTGAVASAAELDEIAVLAEEHNLWVLNDDAYYLIRYGDTPGQTLLSRDGMLARTINLFTFSKQFAITGWRVGAAIGPKAVIDAIARMNTNMESCTTHFIQQAIAEVLRAGSADHVPVVQTLQERRDAMASALNAIDGIQVSAPQSAFYIYCDMSEILRRKNLSSIDTLMRLTLENTGVSFCTGVHFGAGSDSRYARFAFSSLPVEVISEAGRQLRPYLESTVASGG